MPWSWLRIKRYAIFGIQYLGERVRGLDFTMRDITLLNEGNGLHGYSKTNEKHIREIFDSLEIDESDRFLDIGCGKGVVLREAAKRNFGKVSGIDIDSNLINIANRNFEKLKLSDRINCICSDAREFDYSGYNVFYFFNPFCEEFFADVIDKIIGVTDGGIIIYHNPAFADVLESRGISVWKKLYDPMKDYYTYIYKI